jgi:hypothetical protein
LVGVHSWLSTGGLKSGRPRKGLKISPKLWSERTALQMAPWALGGIAGSPDPGGVVVEDVVGGRVVVVERTVVVVAGIVVVVVEETVVDVEVVATVVVGLGSRAACQLGCALSEWASATRRVRRLPFGAIRYRPPLSPVSNKLPATIVVPSGDQLGPPSTMQLPPVEHSWLLGTTWSSLPSRLTTRSP